MRGKLVVIEGTDCSGKGTQTKLLLNRVEKEGYKVAMFDFPNYNSPTGKIIGGPYLGKAHICDSWFGEGAINVDPKVASLYYAADRRYNISKINSLLNQGYCVILDRYVTSNMGHQGGKIYYDEERIKMYKWLYQLEHVLLELPVPDLMFLLYMPYDYAKKLREGREEGADQHEASEEHLRNAEKAYLQLVSIPDMYDWTVINCVDNSNIKTKETIHEEMFQTLCKKLNNNIVINK